MRNKILLNLFILLASSSYGNIIEENINSLGNYGYTVKIEDSDVTNEATIENIGEYGLYDTVDGGTILNLGTIANHGNFGLYNLGSTSISNSGIIENQGSYGLTTYDNTKQVINTKDGIIANIGDNGFYGRTSSQLINDGLIKNLGNKGFVLDYQSSGINNNLIANTGNQGVAVYSSYFINSQSGVIANKGNYGLYISHGGKAINYGTIKNGGEYGVYVLNSSNFINHGKIEAGKKYAIVLGANDSLIHLGTSSKIKGIVEGNRGTNTVNLIDSAIKDDSLNPSPVTEKTIGNIDFKLNNFSNINVSSGIWHLATDTLLLNPYSTKNPDGNFNAPPFSVKNATGTFIIDSGVTLTMLAGINSESTSTLVTNRLINNGTIIQKPLDSVYITNSNIIKVPMIYVNTPTDSIGNVNIVNVAEDWKGNYEYKDGILYLVLNKISNEVPSDKDSPKPFLGGYYDSVYFYPKNNIPYMNNLKFRNKQYEWNRNKIERTTQYAELLSGYGKYTNGDFNPDYSYSTYGVQGATVFPISNKLNISLGYGYIGNNVKYKESNASKEKIDTYSFALSADYKVNNIITTLQGSFGYSDHDLTRKVEDRDDNYAIKQLTSDFGSYVGSIGGEIGYEYSNISNLSLYPYIGLDYVWDKKESYDEKESYNGLGNSYAMHLDSSTLSTPISKLGLKGIYRYSSYSLSGNINWQHRFKNFEDEDAYFKFNPDVNVKLNGIDIHRNAFVINLNIEKDINPSMKVNVGVNSIVSTNNFENSILVGLKYKF